MGIAVSGIVRAEGNTTTSVLPGDRIVIQRFQSNNNGAYWVPYEATAAEFASGPSGTLVVTALGTATFNGSGTIAVAMASITASAVVFATEQGSGAAAVSVAVTPSTGFTLTSSNNTDGSLVNYIVYDV